MDVLSSIPQIKRRAAMDAPSVYAIILFIVLHPTSPPSMRSAIIFPCNALKYRLVINPAGEMFQVFCRFFPGARFAVRLRKWINPQGNAAFCIFAQQPFATDLIASNRKMFRYDLIMEKQKATGFLNCKRMPLRKHEHVEIFYRALPTYNPQKFYVGTTSRRKGNGSKHKSGNVYNKGTIDWDSGYTDGSRFPLSVISPKYESIFFDSHDGQKNLHPTQKPLEMLEWLIKTYSHEGDLVLDPFMGSGSTGVAAMRLGRRFVGMEMDAHWFNAACARIAKEIENNGLLLNVV